MVLLSSLTGILLSLLSAPAKLRIPNGRATEASQDPPAPPTQQGQAQCTSCLKLHLSVPRYCQEQLVQGELG